MSGGRTLALLVTEDWYVRSHRWRLAREARRRGWRVVVLTRVGRHGEEMREAGFEVVALPWRRRSRNPWNELRALAAVTAAYRRIRPDVVHHVALKPIVYGSIAAGLAGVRGRVNAVAGMGFAFASPRRGARVVRGVLLRTMRRLAGAGGAVVVVQNPDDAALVVGRRMAPADRVVVIRGAGVDVDRFRPGGGPADPPRGDGSASGRPGVTRAVLVSRMLWSKGVGELVEAARRLRRAGAPVRVRLVGGPDPETPDSIPPDRLAAWRDTGVVEWVGEVADVRPHLHGADVAVLPSYREGLPKSLLEAAACGLPMVATDVPGCREVVRDGETGILVPPRDPVALADALEALAADADGRRRMGEAARRMVEAEFDEARIVERTLALYDRVAGGAGKGGRGG